MKSKEDPIFILFFIMICIVVYLAFYLRNKWADKENKKRILEALKNAFITNNFVLLAKLEWDYSSEIRELGLKEFGKYKRVALDDIDTDIISDIFGFKVQPYDKFVMNHFFGGTLTDKTEGYKKISCHHVLFRFYKYEYICEIGTKEVYTVNVEKHYGSPSWYNNEMHYNYGIGQQDFYSIVKDKEDVKRMWDEAKKYMFNE